MRPPGRAPNTGPALPAPQTPGQGNWRPTRPPGPAPEAGSDRDPGPAGSGIEDRLARIARTAEAAAKAAQLAARFAEDAPAILNRVATVATLLGLGGGLGGIGIGWAGLKLLGAAARLVRGRKKKAGGTVQVEETRETAGPEPREEVEVGVPSDVRYVPYRERCPSCRAWEMAVDELVRQEPGLRDAAEKLRWYYRQYLSGEKGR